MYRYRYRYRYRARGQLWAFCYLALRHLLGLILSVFHSEASKNAELLALPHEVPVLRRQVGTAPINPPIVPCSRRSAPCHRRNQPWSGRREIRTNSVGEGSLWIRSVPGHGGFVGSPLRGPDETSGAQSTKPNDQWCGTINRACGGPDRGSKDSSRSAGRTAKPASTRAAAFPDATKPPGTTPRGSAPDQADNGGSGPVSGRTPEVPGRQRSIERVLWRRGGA
jgi:hypothetical protein